MFRILLSLLCLCAAVRPQNPADPTGCSLRGLEFGNNPDCNDVLRRWQWPLPPNACYRASVLGVLGDRELAPAQKPFSYVTGHTDPATGREFALLSAWNGLVIVDADYISEHGPTPLRPWYHFRADPVEKMHRGTASFGEYIYESNLFRPTLCVTHLHVNGGTPVATALPDVPLPAGASYRLTVDRVRGHLYVPTQLGLRIYDVNGANGAAPLLLAVWRGWLLPAAIVPSFDVHLDHDGGTVRAFVSEYLTIGVTHIAVLDVTNLPNGSPAVDPWTPPHWVAFPASVPNGSAAHSSWMDDDHKYLYSSVGDVATVVFDMRGFPYYGANRVLLVNEIPHLVLRNGVTPPTPLQYPAAPLRQMGMLGLGMTGYASSWQEGLRVYDLRPDLLDPTEPLAAVDTCHSTTGLPYGGPSWSFLYPGAFATWRAQDSGVLYVADVDNGLFFVRLNVGHLHRYGKGTAELHNGGLLLPRIVAPGAPPRAHTAAAVDPDQRIRVTDAVPGRVVMLIVSSEGTPSGTPFPFPLSPCEHFLAGFVAAPFFATADANGQAEFALPPVLPAQFRLFVQAFVLPPAGFQCSAASRPTWFGLAEPR
jgi:hypothetical protein